MPDNEILSVLKLYKWIEHLSVRRQFSFGENDQHQRKFVKLK